MLQKFYCILSVAAACLGQTARAGIFYVNAASTNAVWPYGDWSTAAGDIQTAVDAASDNDVVLVTNGLYATGGRAVFGVMTNRVVLDKAVILRSVNGPEVTIIQGNQPPAGSTAYTNDVRGVYMTNNAVLDGFTVRGGATLAAWDANAVSRCGGGVFCQSTNAILTNCILSGNMCPATSSGAGGGGVYQGTLLNCILTSNSCPNYFNSGGGAWKSVLRNCIVTSNSASFGGGAAESVLDHCSIVQNYAPAFGSNSSGGGTCECTADHCLLTGNLSDTGGGGDYSSLLIDCVISNNACIPRTRSVVGNGGGCYAGQPNPSTKVGLINCLVISNVCYGNGGGVYIRGNGNVSPAMANCTITGNTATNFGGGIYQGRATNCIIYGNVSSSFYYDNVYMASFFNCWTNDPQFVNPATGDYHLSSTSPCINAGVNMAGAPATDLDDNPRIAGSRVDIGCYEFQSPASILPYAWLEQYSLPTDGSADYADTDGTGMNNWQKWIAGLNPTNPASLFVAQAPAAVSNPAGITVTWQSVNTRSYYVQRSPDLSQPFATIGTNIAGKAGTTSFTDTSATNAGPYLYRIGVQP